MNKFFEKATQVLKLLEGYCNRVAKMFKLVGATLNFLQAETYEMQELCEQIMLQALAEWESVENKIKMVKEEITKKDVKEEE